MHYPFLTKVLLLVVDYEIFKCSFEGFNEKRKKLKLKWSTKSNFKKRLLAHFSYRQGNFFFTHYFLKIEFQDELYGAHSLLQGNWHKLFSSCSYLFPFQKKVKFQKYHFFEMQNIKDIVHIKIAISSLNWVRIRPDRPTVLGTN